MWLLQSNEATRHRPCMPPLSLIIPILIALPRCSTSPEWERQETLQGISTEELTRSSSPRTILESLTHPDSRVRIRAALALGRMGHALTAMDLMAALENEHDKLVIREILLAIGRLGETSARGAPEKFLTHTDDRVREAATEALGRLKREGSILLLVSRLTDREEKVRAAAAIALWRIGDRERGVTRRLPPKVYLRRTQALSSASRDPSPEVRYRAIYALAGIADEEGRDALVRGASDEDPRCRLFALRGLARISPDEALFQEIIDGVADSDYRVVIESLRALKALLESRETHEMDCEPLIAQVAIRLLAGTDLTDKHDSAHVRATATGLVGLLKDDHVRAIEALEAALMDASNTVRGSALVALSKCDPSRASRELSAFLNSDSFQCRVYAAQCCASLDRSTAQKALERLLADSDARVKVAALEAAGKSSLPVAWIRDRAIEALSTEDVSLAGTAAQLLEQVGRPEDSDLLEQAIAKFDTQDGVEARQLALIAITKLGHHNQVIEVLRGLLEDPSQAIRVQARSKLEELTGEAIRVSPAPLEMPFELEFGVDVFSEARNPVVSIKTSQGVIGIQLYRESAPMHVKAFLERMHKGRHDDGVFHRVVPNWVVQGLDPRGDGWGTGGITLPHEINDIPYERGTVGMPTAGPDTGGCQLFITLLPTPRLDGDYTVFGQVISGMDVLDQIEVGDPIEWVHLAGQPQDL